MMMMTPAKLRSELNLHIQPQRSPVLMKKTPSGHEPQPAQLLAPWWAPTVIVVNKQMLMLGLLWPTGYRGGEMD
jgi:hypothetical protein